MVGWIYGEAEGVKWEVNMIIIHYIHLGNSQN